MLAVDAADHRRRGWASLDRTVLAPVPSDLTRIPKHRSFPFNYFKCRQDQEMFGRTQRQYGPSVTRKGKTWPCNQVGPPVSTLHLGLQSAFARTKEPWLRPSLRPKPSVGGYSIEDPPGRVYLYSLPTPAYPRVSLWYRGWPRNRSIPPPHQIGRYGRGQRGKPHQYEQNARRKTRRADALAE